MANAKKKTTTKDKLKPIKPKAIMTAEENLTKLRRSRLPVNFVKEHNFNWNHQDWLDFLALIKEKGYDPIDTDMVGIILEEKKAEHAKSQEESGN